MDISLVTGIILTGCIYYIFNPYMAFKPKNNIQRWTTREKSYGHPHYWKLRYCPSSIINHPNAYNRHTKKRHYFRNVMYIE